MKTEFLKMEVDEDFLSLQQEHFRKVWKAEEDMLLKRLTTHLNRVPNVDDFKRCQMVYRAGIEGQYTFCYDNVPLGYVKRNYEALSCNVTFTPTNL